MIRDFILVWMVLMFGIGLPFQVNAQSGSPEPRQPEDLIEPDFFPFSVWYSGGKARAPMWSEITPESRQEWREDLQQIKDLGFNTVRTWVEWQRAEPEPGKYDLENLELLLELAEEVDLKVIIQMYADSAPDWVGKQHPEAKFKTQADLEVESQAAPGYCTDHEKVGELVSNFYTETAKVASAYDNFYGWDLWSEPHIINWAQIDYQQNPQFCYCQFTQQRFREWLQEKYDTIDRLNTAWHRSFEAWEDVSPPRFSTILSYTDYLDWKTFIYDKMAADLKTRYDAVRKGDPENVITSHAAVSSIILSPHMGVGAADDFLMSESVDYYGVSLYPKHNHPDRHWPPWRVMNMMDFARSANLDNDGWYVGELQAGIGTISLLISDPVTPGDHRVWIWSAIAKQARSVNIYAYYPMSSGYESGGYGLINLDGTVTERAEEAGKLAQVVDQNQELFLDSSPVESEVAIVYNPLSQMVGGAQRADEFQMGHHDSLIGYYRVFAENNIPVDFIHRQDLESEDLSQYKLVLLPWSMMLTEEAASGVKNFIEEGGYVVGEARTAWNDERGYAGEEIPGMGLSEVFGVRENDVWMREDEDIPLSITDTDHPVTQNLETGNTLTGALFGKSVTQRDDSQSKVLAQLDKTGDPAVVTNQFGEGEALMVGTFLGMANHPDQKEYNNDFILGLAGWAGINRPVQTSHDGRSEEPVAARLHENEEGKLLFLINHGESDETVTVTFDVEVPGTFELSELITGRKLTLDARDEAIEFEAEPGARNVEVWRINQQP